MFGLQADMEEARACVVDTRQEGVPGDGTRSRRQSRVSGTGHCWPCPSPAPAIPSVPAWTPWKHPQVTVVRMPRGLRVSWFMGHFDVSLPGSPRVALGPVQGWLERQEAWCSWDREHTEQVAPSPNAGLKCRGSKWLFSGQRWCWDKSLGLLDAVHCHHSQSK